MAMSDVANHFRTALGRVSTAHDDVYEAAAELRRLDGEVKGTEDAFVVDGVVGSNAEIRAANLRIAVTAHTDQAVMEAAQKAKAVAARDMDVNTKYLRFLQTVADFEVAQSGESTAALAALTAEDTY
jgi:hypothetical protein